jgi:hypothetical protein
MQRNRGSCRLQCEGNEEATLRASMQRETRRLHAVPRQILLQIFDQLHLKFSKNLGNFEIKNSKKLESISKFLVKIKFIISKQRILQIHTRSKWFEKRKNVHACMR